MDTKSDFIPGKKYCFSAKDGQYYIGTYLHTNAVGRAVFEVNRSYWYVCPGNVFRVPVSEKEDATC